jgi:hypothetical protein
MVLVSILFIVSQTVQVCSSYWLSDWSDKVDEESHNPELRNRRLIVYVAFGLGQSNKLKCYLISLSKVFLQF